MLILAVLTLAGGSMWGNEGLMVDDGEPKDLK